MSWAKFASAAFCLFLGWASVASAGPILFNSIDSDDEAWFYNKPGITLAQLEEDFSACQRFGQAMQSGDGEAAFATHGLVGALVVGANAAAPVRAFADNCMIARGYRRFAPAEHNQRAFLRRYEALGEEARLALASNETPPEGTLARAWDNVYWLNDATRVVARPPIIMRTRSREFFSIERVDQVALNAPISLGPDQTLLIMTLRSGPADTPRGGVVQFSRHDPETGIPSPVATRPNGRRMRLPVVGATLSGADVGAERRVYAWVVPAGYYAISGIWSVGGYMSSFCMGTPAFNAEPGAVLYLGDYMIVGEAPRMPRLMASPGPGVDFERGDLDAARAQLTASPDLAARLAAAEYRNGFVRACPWESILVQYGLDLPGVPWLDEGATEATAP